jgi:acyl-CoA reductase-like NAD-dependent aldehyde dehydrogenase
MQNYRMHIGGEWVEAADGAFFESFDPFLGKPWARIPRGKAADADRAVAAAHSAYVSGDWRKLTATARGHLLRRLGDLISQNAEALARIEVTDNGKLMSEMRGQLRYIPQWYHYFGGLADKLEGSVIPIDKPDLFTFTRQEPLGVCAAITAWNSPLLLAAWKLAPGLAAGNTFVLKPSEYTSASALEFARLVVEAGFPPGVVNVLTGFGAEVGEPLINHPLVAKISFTGGDAAGQRIAEAAARGLKRVTLELGGKSPNIVFDDANIANAVRGVVAGIFAATGQTCIAGSRLLVQETIHKDFVERVVEFARTARMGDPQDVRTQVGPVTTQAQYHSILEKIEMARNEGARCVLGGGPAKRPECGDGWFVEPTIFADVNNQMRIAREEVFGPVLVCIPFSDEDEAVAIANDSPYGLAAGVWTQSMSRAITMSERIQAGTVWVNTYRAASFMMPFGGYKRSGIGRENGIDAIQEYLQTKSVWISTAAEMPDPFVMR